MERKFDVTVNIVLVVCAIVVTGLVVRREFFVAEPARAAEPKPVRVPDWQKHLAAGERIGPPSAPLEFVVFSDFQCPYCAQFYKDVQQVRGRFPDKVALTYLHFPLPMHKSAEDAARAAECADAQSRSEQIYEVLFRHQRELGKTPWVELAKEASVPDLAVFDACMSSQGPLDRLEQSRRWADELHLKGTPTVIVNGWMLPLPPNAADMVNMLERVVAGKQPVPLSKA